MFGLTTDASATDSADPLPPRPDVHTPRSHPDVRAVEAKLREVRAEIGPLENQRQQAIEERRRIENEQSEAREDGDHERLTRLRLEEDQIDQLGQQEHERLMDLHSRAMRLTEKREEVRHRVVPEIEDALEQWAAPRLQELANLCQRLLDLHEGFALLASIRDHNRMSQLPGQHFAPVRPSVPSVDRPGGLGQVESILRQLRAAGFQPQTDQA